jgi:hypothetical protein
VIYVGIDWAEAHHDLCVLDKAGARRTGLRSRIARLTSDYGT